MPTERQVRQAVAEVSRRATAPVVSAEEAGIVRRRMVRAYPHGNVADQAARAETLEDLKNVVNAVRGLRAAGLISTRALKRAQRAVDARKAELESRILIPGAKLRVAEHLRRIERRSPGGLILP
jgi:hypothetical protein